MKKLLLACLPTLGLLMISSQAMAYCKIDCGLGAYFKIQCGCNKQFNLGAFKSFSWTSFDDCWANGGCNNCGPQQCPPRCGGGPGGPPCPPRPPFPYGACGGGPGGPGGYPGTYPPMMGGGAPQGGPWYQYWPQQGQFQMPAPTGGPAAFGMMTLPPNMCAGGMCPQPCPLPIVATVPPACSTTQPVGPSLPPATPSTGPKDGPAVPGPQPVEPLKQVHYSSIHPVSYRPQLKPAPGRPATPSKPQPTVPSYWYPD